MKLVVALACLISLYISIAYADTLYHYRRVPFNITAPTSDVLIINYDMTNHAGISCTSDVETMMIDFNHHGHDKVAQLPVVLQNNHVPTESYEELADTIGQFKIYMENQDHEIHEFYVTCRYL